MPTFPETFKKWDDVWNALAPDAQDTLRAGNDLQPASMAVFTELQAELEKEVQAAIQEFNGKLEWDRNIPNRANFTFKLEDGNKFFAKHRQDLKHSPASFGFHGDPDGNLHGHIEFPSLAGYRKGKGY